MRGTVAFVGLLAAVGLAACGGGDEPATQEAPSAATTTVEEPPVEEPASQPAETEAVTETDRPATTDAPEPEPAALPGLPGYTAGYESWPRLNAEPIPPNPDGDAHLGTKNVYASEEAGSDGVYPDGTVIVKDAVRPDADFIGLVAVMRKEAGADPAHADWVFVEWTRDAPDGRFEVQARDEICWSCHMGAEATDYVWIATFGLTR